jgi:hypothetical protein
MAETSATLLKRPNNRSDSVARQRLVDVYSPLINAWLRRQGVSAEDADNRRIPDPARHQPVSRSQGHERPTTADQ